MEHERKIECEFEGRALSAAHQLPADLIAIGPEVVDNGELVGSSGKHWRLRLDHFIIGDMATLIEWGEKFPASATGPKYILVNGLGDGRILEQPLPLSVSPVADGFARRFSSGERHRRCRRRAKGGSFIASGSAETFFNPAAP
jgi:hypothetical protein